MSAARYAGFGAVAPDVAALIRATFADLDEIAEARAGLVEHALDVDNDIAKLGLEAVGKGALVRQSRGCRRQTAGRRLVWRRRAAGPLGRAVEQSVGLGAWVTSRLVSAILPVLARPRYPPVLSAYGP